MSEFAAALKKMNAGIEELLASDARVLYENTFSTRHVGRTIDFLLFEARPFFEALPDAAYAEYRVRQALELSVFNAWSNYRKSEKTKCVEIEFGWDKSRLVLLVGHYADDGISSFVPGLPSSPSDPVSKRLSQMLAKIDEMADGLVVRHDPKTGRLEVVAYLEAKTPQVKPKPDYQIRDERPKEDGGAGKRPELVVPAPLSEGAIQPFVESEQGAGSILKFEETAIAPLGEVRATGQTKVLGGAQEKESVEVVSGKAQKEDPLLRALSGGKAPNQSDKIVIQGSGTQSADSSGATVVRGGANHDPAAATHVSAPASTPPDDDLAKLFEGSSPAKGGLKSKDAGSSALGTTTAIDATKAEAAGSAVVSDVAVGSAVVSDAAAVAESGAATSAGLESQIEKLAADPAPEAAAKSEASESREITDSLEILLNTIRTEITPLCTGLSESEFQVAFQTLSQKVREHYTQTFHHLTRMKNIQSVTKVKMYKDQIKTLVERIEELKAANQDLLDALAKRDPVAAKEIKSRRGDPVAQSDSAKKDDEEAKSQEILHQYQTAIDKGEVPSGAQPWAKGLMETVMRDRARLNEKIRIVDAHLRKRDYEYRNAETTFKEEMRIKDEQLRQKEFSLEKTKESLSNTLKTLERTREEFKGSSSGGKDAVQRLIVSERMLASAKENAERSEKRLGEVQKKWQDEFAARSQLQQEFSRLKRKLELLERKSDGGAGESFAQEKAALIQARDRAHQMVEELKKHNKEMQLKLTQALAAAKSPGGGSADATRRATGSSSLDAELKHKLEHANKMSKSMKDELERYRKRYDELKLEETRLRIEVGKLQAQLKTKAAGGGAASGGHKPKS